MCRAWRKSPLMCRSRALLPPTTWPWASTECSTCVSSIHTKVGPESISASARHLYLLYHIPHSALHGWSLGTPIPPQGQCKDSYFQSLTYGLVHLENSTRQGFEEDCALYSDAVRFIPDLAQTSSDLNRVMVNLWCR